VRNTQYTAKCTSVDGYTEAIWEGILRIDGGRGRPPAVSQAAREVAREVARQAGSRYSILCEALVLVWITSKHCR